MWRAVRDSAVGLLLAGLACGPSGQPPEPPPVALSPPAADLAFSSHGVPGPWWRSGATRSDFDAALGECVTLSQAARDAAATDARPDAAYRAFLECMQGGRWTRGSPPRPQSEPVAAG